MFYPELHQNDAYVMEFKLTESPNVKNILAEKLDPNTVRFKLPDFGFDWRLDFEEQDEEVSGAGWRRFMDCISIFPKHERVQNYIEFVNKKKVKKFARQQKVR